MKHLSITSVLLSLLLVAGCATAVLNGTATGSKDYPAQQEDSRITREVRMAIYRDGLLSDERIHVSTAEGIVTLRGSVDNRMHTNRAVEITRSVQGVRGVNIELVLKDSL
ncbi:MAG TPA: BON domain-containing protein [Gammaproteobacteria bacterium]